MIAQVADLVADNFNAPDCVMQMFLTTLFLGLPISLLLSWAFDLTANSAGPNYNEGFNPDAFKGVISLYGMHDPILDIQREHPFAVQYIGQVYKPADAAYRDASPVYHVDSDDPPVLLVHRSLDGSVSVLNSNALSTQLKGAGVPYTYDRVEGWPHAMEFFAPIGERTLWQAYQFLKEHMSADEMR